MEHNKDETTWFDGVTWVDVCTEAGNSITKIPYTATDVYSNETEKKVAGGYELKLGMLLFFPIDIVVDILSRLPVEDLIRGRIVCKSWYKLTKDPYFIHLQVSKAINRPRCLLLEQTAYHCGDKLILVDSENDKWRSKEISLESFHGGGGHMLLSNSCNGLICVSSYRRNPVIYNLLTKECIALPNSDYKPHYLFSSTTTGLALGFDSMNNKYKLVRVYNIWHGDGIELCKFDTKAEIITLGESSWRILNFPHKVTCSSIENPVFLNGAFHWLLHRGKYCSHLDRILVLDCVNETFQTISFPPVVPQDIELINLGGSLALSELCCFNSNVLRTWTIVGSRKDGGRLRQYNFNKSLVHHGHFNREIYLLGMLSNGDFLYKAFETENDNSSSFRFYLVCYNPQKKTRFRLEVPDIPISFNSTLFVPSLVSPCILS